VALRLLSPYALVALAAVGCSGQPPMPDAGPPDAGPPDAGTPVAGDPRRDIVTTSLDIDLSNLSGVATMTVAPSLGTGASFEVGGLRIDSVADERGLPLFYDAGSSLDGGWLDVGLPVRADDSTVVVHYGFTGGRTTFTGLLAGGSTLTWPYFCGNLFPCHSDPTDGVHFQLSVHGNASGSNVFPSDLVADAPAYQVAWATGDYTPLDLGATDAGTIVSAWALPNDMGNLGSGTAHLRDVFEWYEGQLGAYRFGPRVGPVDVVWPVGAYGGMEHHPYWHISRSAIADPVVHAHEAAHGWFGDGVRLRCWEDFVMSEGTVSYLAAHSLGVVEGPASEQAAFTAYQARLNAVTGVVAWPDGCDVHDPLLTFGDAPYMKGAFFYRALANKVGADALVASLARFYAANQGQPAGMQDVLDAVQAQTGYDPTTCAHDWLKATTLPADTTSCP
jgi:hypothetical protein